jgi:hypothetical protein
MMHRPLLCVLPLALFACVPGSKSVGNGETNNADGSGDGSEGSSGSASESGSQSGSNSMSSAGPTGDPTTDDSTTTTAPDTETSLTAADTDLTGTGGGPVCEIHVIVDEAANGKMEPDDCGDLMLFDPVGQWEAAQACALDHYNGSLAFTLVAQLMGIDSDVHEGFAGMQGEVYASARFLSDANGLVPGTLITGGACELAAVVDCEVTQGNLCLTCSNEFDPSTVCETP